MDNGCLKEKFANEIVGHVQRDGSCSIHQLLTLIGPDYYKWEFWEALRFELNNKLSVSRDANSQALQLTYTTQRTHNNPGGWYMYEDKESSYGIVRFYIPPISTDALFKLLAKRSEIDDLKAAVDRVLEQFPELKLFEREWVTAAIVAPALHQLLPKPRARSAQGRFISTRQI